MIIAEMAGIHVFATGGIGGVHRGAEHTFDISADLQELARTNVRGDLCRCQVYFGFGADHRIPRNPRRTADRLPDPNAAGILLPYQPLQGQHSVGCPGGDRSRHGHQVADRSGGRHGDCQPIPAQYAVPEEKINAAIERAVRESVEQGVQGKDSTPFLLARVAELTGGDSLTANIQLVFNNAKLAAQIACCYQEAAA
jgi:pseudouridylate synthase